VPPKVLSAISVNPTPTMSGTAGMAIWPSIFLSQKAFQEVGAGFTRSVEYSITRLSKVQAAPITPGVKARGLSCLSTGMSAGSSGMNSPSSLPALATETSITATSICGASFCARSRPSVWADEPAGY
jgi:hypothetical protein